MMRKYVGFLFVMFVVILLTGCSSNDDSINDDYYNVDSNNYQQTCTGASMWVENGKCCQAMSSGTRVNEYGDCPGMTIPGFEIPAPAIARDMCFSVRCR